MQPTVEDCGHVAARPSWDCRACGRPWPCDPAREALVQELDSVQLAIYAWTSLEEAVRDLPAMPSGELFARFLAWTRQPATNRTRQLPVLRPGP